MTDNVYNYQKQTEYAAYAPIRKAYVITPSANIINCRAIMVSTPCTVTGELVEQPGDSFTTLSLLAGILYPICFSKITGVTNGAIIHAFA